MLIVVAMFGIVTIVGVAVVVIVVVGILCTVIWWLVGSTLPIIF